MGVINKRKD